MKEVKRSPTGPVNETDHLTAYANRLLRGAGKLTWRTLKLLGWMALRIPGVFVKANRKNIDRLRGGRAKEDK